MDRLIQDLRHAARGLRRAPGFTAVALLTLALGIGANTAIFTVLDAALLRPLPYADAERLVHLWELRPAQRDFTQAEASLPNFRDVRARATSFSALSGYTRRSLRLDTPDGAERLFAAAVTADFLDTLGVRPQLGRGFAAGEDAAGAAPVVLLTHGAWVRRFGADPGVVGRTLTVDDRPATVVGVLPAAFHFAPFANAEAVTPLVTRPDQERRTFHWLSVVGRLRPGVSLEAARAELQALGAALAAEHPEANAGATLAAVPLREQLVGDVRPVLLLLLGAVGLVLLVACTNVAHLLLARATVRERELAVRVAVGASRGALLQQLLVEAALLAVLGAAAGVALGVLCLQGLLAAVPEPMRVAAPYLRELTLDGRTLAFAAGLAALAAALFGGASALSATRRLDVHTVLKEGQGAPRGGRARRLLVAAEVALCVVLLVGAGLLARSLARVLAVDPGFRTEGLLTFHVQLPEARYPDAARQTAYYDALLERLAALPGVEGATLDSRLPLGTGGNTLHFVREGQPHVPGQEAQANVRTVTEDYFRVLGVPLRAGRAFTRADGPDAPAVVVVNETLARRFFPGEDPLGQRLVYPGLGPDTPPVTVVGVVGDVRLAGLDAEATPVLYEPLRQNRLAVAGVVLRAPRPEGLAAAVRAELRALDPGVAVFALRTMEEGVEASPWLFLRRFPALLVGALAGLALLLALVGVYGVVAYAVAQRTRELGLRLALGADARRLRRMLLGEGLRMVLPGVAAGLVLALALGQAVARLLFGVQPEDPWVLLGVPALLLLAAAAAIELPARRAGRVAPADVLR